jgi:curved DNA-binding protein
MAGAAKDPYSILGVPRDADASAIKRAYRRLAQQHHPDRNQDDAVAEERFKAISGAYAVLSDSDRRKDYDEFGEIALDPNFNAKGARQARHNPFGGGGFSSRGFGGGNSGSLFDEFFANAAGGFSRQRGPRKVKGRDREVTVELDLREASEGCERSLTAARAGSGTKPTTLRVQIPRGTRNDARIRLAGKGDPGAHGGPDGDLYCRIKLRPHAFFRVDEYDLNLDVPISLKEAILGAEIEIPTLSGRVTLNVPAGTDAGTRLRLRGKGMARPGEKPAGDLYLTLLIQVPKELDEDARNQLDELDRLGPANLRDHLLE